MASNFLIGRVLANTAAIAAFLACTAWPAAAVDTTYPRDGDNPLKITSYFLSPVGTLLEWTVTRPLAVFGNMVVPRKPVSSAAFRGCGRERPARSCTEVVR